MFYQRTVCSDVYVEEDCWVFFIMKYRLVSYSRFPVRFCTKLSHQPLHGTVKFVTQSAIRSRNTNRMPHPDIWNRARLFTHCTIFAASACRISALTDKRTEIRIVRKKEIQILKRYTKAIFHHPIHSLQSISSTKIGEMFGWKSGI